MVRPALLLAACVLALAACSPASTSELLPAAAELGPGFQHPWELTAEDPRFQKRKAWRAAHPHWTEQEGRARSVARDAAEWMRRFAGEGEAAADGAATCLRLGGLFKPTSLAERAGLASIATNDNSLIDRSSAGIVTSARTGYLRSGLDGGSVRLDVTVLVGHTLVNLAEIGYADLDDAAIDSLLPAFAELAGSGKVTTAMDRTAERRALAALVDRQAAGADLASTLHTVVERVQAEVVVTARTLGVGDGSHAVIVQRRTGGIARTVNGFAYVRVGRALLVIGIDADGAQSATVAAQVPALAARLAAGLAVYQ